MSNLDGFILIGVTLAVVTDWDKNHNLGQLQIFPKIYEIHHSSVRYVSKVLTDNLLNLMKFSGASLKRDKARAVSSP